MSPPLTLLALCCVAAALTAGCAAAQSTNATGASVTGVCTEYNGTHAPYNYSMRGADWASNKAWMCGGSKQSPVELFLSRASTYLNVSSAQSVRVGAPDVQAAGVLNLPQWEIEVLGNFSGNGLAVPVCNGTDIGCLHSPGAEPKLVNVTIANLHFHTPSEHTIDGEYFALESHLVTRVPQKDVPTCPKLGCIAVFGVVFRISDDQTNNTFLDQILPYVNQSGAGCNALPENQTLKLLDAFPANRTYATYSGSLTTPPCSEGVLWTVFLTPLRVSSKQLQVISESMYNVQSCVTTPQGTSCSTSGFQADSRMLQDLNGRQLHMFATPPSAAPTLG